MTLLSIVRMLWEELLCRAPGKMIETTWRLSVAERMETMVSRDMSLESGPDEVASFSVWCSSCHWVQIDAVHSRHAVAAVLIRVISVIVWNYSTCPRFLFCATGCVEPRFGDGQELYPSLVGLYGHTSSRADALSLNRVRGRVLASLLWRILPWTKIIRNRNNKCERRDPMTFLLFEQHVR